MLTERNEKARVNRDYDRDNNTNHINRQYVSFVQHSNKKQ